MEAQIGRSPLTHAPERQAGETLREQFFKAFVNRLLFPLTIVCVMWIMALVDWIRVLVRASPHPVVSTAFAVIATGVFALWWWPRVRRQFESLVKGERGERAVGDTLSDLSGDGYRVVHDIEFRGDDGRYWNVDHVLVGPSGVYVVESKYRTLPSSGAATIWHNGSELVFSDGWRDGHWLRQVRASSTHIGRLVRSELGIGTFARGVVVVPGWRIDGSSGRDEWVLTPGALRKWLRQEEQGERSKLTQRERDRIVELLQGLPRSDWLA